MVLHNRMMKRNDEYDENTKKKVMIYLRYVQDAEGNLDSLYFCYLYLS